MALAEELNAVNGFTLTVVHTSEHVDKQLSVRDNMDLGYYNEQQLIICHSVVCPCPSEGCYRVLCRRPTPVSLCEVTPSHPFESRALT